MVSLDLASDIDAISSRPMGQFAIMLDEAISGARLTPAPNHQAGSYLVGNAHAVWIPSLGSSVPFGGDHSL
jgi:hypothetical protein